MIKVRDDKDQVNIAKVYKAGQEHILRFWDELDPAEQRGLLDQLAQIDFQLLGQLIRSTGEKPRLRKLAPPPEVLRTGSTEELRRRDARAVELGREALARGRVAGLIVSGGQGTRLGFEGPKGCYPIGPVSERSLFQIHAEKALAIARRHRASFPLYVMTSASNHDEVVSFWRAHDHFGLSAAEVFFFRQRHLPAVDPRGRLLLADRGRIAMSPDGHGGVIQALAHAGALDDMERRGVEYVSYWHVDNPLVRVHDPRFLGLLVAADAEAAAKVARKRDPLEPIGVWALIDGDLGVIEYTELPEEDAQRLDGDGRFLFDAGNIGVHVFRRSFLRRVATEEPEELPFHQARKRVPFIDRDQHQVTPEEPNGIKFEQFVFDAFRRARRVILLETDRVSEFGPVKNPSGEDSPDSARAALSELYAGWLEAAGAKVRRDAGGRVAVPVEVSPLVADSAEELARKVEPGLLVEEPFRL